MFSTYIIYSQALNRYYVGQTSDFTERLEQHRSGQGRWTGQATDWTCVFLQTFATREESLRLERRIKKSKSRASILRYVQSDANEVQ